MGEEKRVQLAAPPFTKTRVVETPIEREKCKITLKMDSTFTRFGFHLQVLAQC